MTREEAINIVKGAKQYLTAGNPIWDVKKIDEALSMAIEALQTDAEHDGCDGCRYEHNTEYEYPCSECKQNHVDMWEQKPNDFIDVVRCKDCRHRYEEGDNTHYYWCRLNDRPIDDTDYCSWAERREP